MRNPIAVLKSLTEKSKDVNYKFKRLFRNLYNPEFYWLAHKNIYANKGSMTAGVDGSTMDNMSDKRIEKVISSLKSGSYKPNPARREYIEKKNSKKKRPLGIPSGDDKLVQEVVRMILESIFEPNLLSSVVLVAFPPPVRVANVKFSLVFLHELIQFVQIDVLNKDRPEPKWQGAVQNPA